MGIRWGMLLLGARPWAVPPERSEGGEREARVERVVVGPRAH